MNVKNIQSAAKLRILLGVILVLTLAAIGGGFYYAQKILRSYAAETSMLNSQASASTQNLSSLRQIETYLGEHKEDIDRAKEVVAESKQYRYQDEIIRDISSFASASGVNVTSFQFTDAQTTGPTNGTSTTSPTTTPITAVPTGVKPTTATITLAQPVRYSSLLNFMNRIEKNITRMQIGSVSISRSVGENGATEISSNAFIIEVYLRK